MRHLSQMEICEPKLIDLPDEILVDILRYLYYRDLTRLSATNKKFHRLCGDDKLWRWQCQHYFLEDQCTEGLPWSQNFITLYQEYGKYPDFKELKIAWTKIRDFCKENCPVLYANLHGGGSEEDLDELESVLGHALPLDFRASYRICDGQDALESPSGVLGGSIIHHYSITVKLYDTKTTAEIQRRFADSEGKYHKLGLFKFGFVESSCCLSLAFSDVGGFTPGHVYKPNDDRDVEPHCDYFCYGAFKDYIVDYANKLTSNEYHVVNNCIYRFFHEPNCLATTSGITVKPTTCFVPDFSRTQHYFFSYRIILTMAKDVPASLSCQLETRHWVITDGTGAVEYVNGPGVVGEHPIMKPGTEFSWISCCTFTTPNGNMKGQFRFRNLMTGAMVDIECPCFYMQSPPAITHEDTTRNKLLQQATSTSN